MITGKSITSSEVKAGMKLARWINGNWEQITWSRFWPPFWADYYVLREIIKN
jgi:hypothetical protein